MKREKKGITLVALVITIIILLILAGITINTLNNTGIFDKAKMAKEKSAETKERELIQLTLYNNELDKFDNKNGMKIGEQLYDKSVENGSKWHIIVMKDLNKTYGTGYMYLAKDSNIENTKLMYNWIVDDSNQNIIKLDDNSFTELSYKTAIGVTDGLIFNLDPSVIDNATKDNINEKLGQNVELLNFDWNENSGLTKKSFNFDGVNDYIKVKYDNEEEKNKLAKNGFTFEFYGIFNGGTSYNEQNVAFNSDYKGLFCYWNGVELQQAILRFGTGGYGNNIYWNAGWANVRSDYSRDGMVWNIEYPRTELIQANKELHFSISVDTSQDEYKHTLYVNGKKLYDGRLNNKYWEKFVNNEINDLKYFCIGRSSMSNAGWWHYSKMKAYSVKLYNRGLNEQEVQDNYNKAVAYHNAD